MLRRTSPHGLIAFLVLAATAAALATLSGGAGGMPRPQSAGAAAAALVVDQCIEVGVNETFEVDVFVSDISQLLAWNIYYAFNPDIVEVVDRNVHRLLEAAPTSSVFDFSDPVPNVVGLYRMGAADTGGEGAAENGSGLLATMTLLAKGKGVSWSALFKADVNGDGTIDIGPTLTALRGQHIDDNNGDGVFDGPIRNGQIAVDTECEATAPTPTLAPGSIVIDEPAVTPVVTIDESPGTGPGPESATEASPDGASSTDDPSPTATSPSAVLTGSDIGREPRPDNGGGSSLATWLVGALAGSAGLGVILTYAIYRTRRPV